MGLGRLTAASFVLLFCVSHAAAQSNYGQRTTTNQRRTNSTAQFSSQYFSQQARNSAVPRFNYTNFQSNVFGNSPLQKPFSNLRSGPSVTPYLGLSSPFTSAGSNYYQFVRPQQEQQRINDQLDQRNAMLQHQLNSISAHPPYEVTGDSHQAPTGHASVYMNTGSYYPQSQQPRR